MKRAIKQVVLEEGPWIYLALVVIAALSTAILLGFVIHQQHQITQQAEAIQQERIDSILRACEDQNTRHDSTVKTLDAVIAKLPPGPQHDQAKASERYTILLINALSPKQDCQKLATSSVPSG